MEQKPPQSLLLELKAILLIAGRTLRRVQLRAGSLWRFAVRATTIFRESQLMATLIQPSINRSFPSRRRQGGYGLSFHGMFKEEMQPLLIQQQ